MNRTTPEAKKPFLKLKQFKNLLAGTGVVVVLGALSVGGAHHRLTLADRRVEAPWGQIRRLVQRQLDLTSELASLLEGSFPGFKKPLRRLEKSRQQLFEQHRFLRTRAAQRQLHDYEKAQQEMAADVERVLRVVSDIPSVTEDQRFLEWVGCYRATQKLLLKEKERYNSLAARYNRSYETFFVHWVAERFKLQNRPIFRNG